LSHAPDRQWNDIFALTKDASRKKSNYGLEHFSHSENCQLRRGVFFPEPAKHKVASARANEVCRRTKDGREMLAASSFQTFFSYFPAA
jgi:hypothetical protein